MGSVTCLMLFLQLLAVLGNAAEAAAAVAAVAHSPASSPSTSSFDREVPATGYTPAIAYAPGPLGSGSGAPGPLGSGSGSGSGSSGGSNSGPDPKPGPGGGAKPIPPHPKPGDIPNPVKPGDPKPPKPVPKPGEKPAPKPNNPNPAGSTPAHGNNPGSAQSPYASTPDISPAADEPGFPSPAESPSMQVAPSSPPTTAAVPPSSPPPPPTIAAVPPPPAYIPKVVIKGNVSCSNCNGFHHNGQKSYRHKSRSKARGISGVTVILSCPASTSSTTTNQHGKYKIQFRHTIPSGFPSACDVYLRNSTIPQTCNVSTTATSFTPELQTSSQSSLTYSVPGFVFRPAEC